MISAYIFLKKYYKYNFKLYLYIFCNLGVKCCTLAIPYLTKMLIDQIETQNTDNFKAISIVLILVMLLFSIFLSFKYYFQNDFEISVLNDLKKDMLSKVLNIHNENLKNFSTGEFIQKIFNDTEIIRPLIISTYVDVIINIFYSFAIIIIMFSLNTQITVLLLLLIPVFIIFYMLYIPKIEKINTDIIKKDEQLKSLSQEILTGALDVKINNANKFIMSKSQTLLKQYSRLLLIKTKYFMQYDYILVTGIMNFSTLLIYCFGGYLVLKNLISVGTLISFTLYFSRLWAPVEYFMQLSKNIKLQILSLDRIKAFFNMESEENSIITPLPNFECLKVEDLNFSYKDRIIFENLNFKLLSGDKIGVKGSNGTGKSTFAHLITKLLNDYTGSIYYNNLNYNLISSMSIRNKVIFIPSKVFLFNGTIAENIALNTNNAEVLVNDFIEKYNCSHLFETLFNNGRNLNTIINNQSNNLSGGEQKIIQILRGLFLNGEIYILDEPFNYVDITYKKILVEFIQNNLSSKTIIIISHDEEIFKCCNKIYTLTNGILVQQ